MVPQKHVHFDVCFHVDLVDIVSNYLRLRRCRTTMTLMYSSQHVHHNLVG